LEPLRGVAAAEAETLSDEGSPTDSMVSRTATGEVSDGTERMIGSETSGVGVVLTFVAQEGVR
jgi:hypothetical protein